MPCDRAPEAFDVIDALVTADQRKTLAEVCDFARTARPLPLHELRAPFPRATYAPPSLARTARCPRPPRPCPLHPSSRPDRRLNHNHAVPCALRRCSPHRSPRCCSRSRRTSTSTTTPCTCPRSTTTSAPHTPSSPRFSALVGPRRALLGTAAPLTRCPLLRDVCSDGGAVGRGPLPDRPAGRPGADAKARRVHLGQRALHHTRAPARVPRRDRAFAFDPTRERVPAY